MATFDPGPLAAVMASAGAGGWTLTFVKDFAHPVAKVWAALTDADQVGRWAPFTTDRTLDHTGPAVLTMIDGATSVDSSAMVTRVEPPTLLEYTWGEDLLRWELAATGAGTRLMLSHRHAERDWLPRVAAGWHLCLVVAQRLLDGSPVEPIRGSEAMNYGWQSLNDAYADALGIPSAPSAPSASDD